MTQSSQNQNVHNMGFFPEKIHHQEKNNCNKQIKHNQFFDNAEEFVRSRYKLKNGLLYFLKHLIFSSLGDLKDLILHQLYTQ